MYQKEKKNGNKDEVVMLTLDMLVPEDHLLREIDRMIDFEEIYPMVEACYSDKNCGRPGIDPIILIKLVLIQHIYGIRSLRQTVKEVEVNAAYRWFVGLSLLEPVPHFATISYAFSKRFPRELSTQIFEWVLTKAYEKGLIDESVVFVDGTHVKASANPHKRTRKKIQEKAKSYEKELWKELNEDRKKHGKKPFDGPNPPKEREIVSSSTDPESGLFHKGEHKIVFAYAAHTACDRNGYVLETVVRPGNEHDSTVFSQVYQNTAGKFPGIETVVADAGYKTPAICREVIKDGKNISLPYKRPMTKKGYLYPKEYAYSEESNSFVCPNGKQLNYTTTNRKGYREYKSHPCDCVNCPCLHRCTNSKDHTKVLHRHIWQDYLDQAEKFRLTPEGKESYALRSQKIERVFADAKEKHGMRYTFYKGLDRVQSWIRLKFAAMNLKKMALWNRRLALGM